MHATLRTRLCDDWKVAQVLNNGGEANNYSDIRREHKWNREWRGRSNVDWFDEGLRTFAVHTNGVGDETGDEGHCGVWLSDVIKTRNNNQAK